MMPTLVGLEARDDFEEALDLSLAQRGGRLVHDEDPRVRADRLGDLDQLLLGHAESLDEPIGVDVCADPRQQIARVPAAAPPIDLAPPRARLERERDVLGNRQMREQRRLLINRRDAQRARRGRAHLRHRSAGHGQRP